MHTTNLATHKVFLCKESELSKKKSSCLRTNENLGTESIPALCKDLFLTIMKMSVNCLKFDEFHFNWNKNMSGTSSSWSLGPKLLNFIIKILRYKEHKIRKITMTKHNLFSGMYTKECKHVRQQKGGSHRKLCFRLQQKVCTLNAKHSITLW